MDDKGNQPLSVLLRNPSWNMRKEGYERLLYSLKSGSRQVVIGGELVTLEKMMPLINMLGSEQNSVVTLHGIECLKLIIEQPGFKVSNINHFLSQGLEKYGSLGRLAVEFEALLGSLTVRWCSYVVGLITSKMDNKNPKVQLYCLQILQSPSTLERILRNREAVAQIANSVSQLCNSQNRQVKTLAQELANVFGQPQRTAMDRSQMGKKLSLEGLYSELIRTFDQITNDRRIELAKQLRQSVEELLRQGRLHLDTDNDHFGLHYTLRLMVDDSNQLLWAEGVRIFNLLIPEGFLPREINFIVEKLRLGKSVSNQLIYQLFDAYLLQIGSKRTDEYLSSLKEQFESSSKENVKVGALQLVARLAYLLNFVEQNNEVCQSIQEKLFFGQGMFTNFEELNQESEQLKRRLICSYNKIGLGWLVHNRTNARYKELIEQVLLAMKPYDDKNYLLPDKEPKISQKPTEVPTKKEGLLKLFGEIMTAVTAPLKELEKKIASTEEFMRNNQKRYNQPFYLLDLLHTLTVKLQQISLNAASADKLSTFVIGQLKRFLVAHRQADEQSCGLFLELTFKRLSFSRQEHVLTELLQGMTGVPLLFPCLLRQMKIAGMIAKRFNLRILQRWLRSAEDDLISCGWYTGLLEIVESNLAERAILKNEQQHNYPEEPAGLDKYINQPELHHEKYPELYSAPKENKSIEGLLHQHELMDSDNSRVDAHHHRINTDSLDFEQVQPQSGEFQMLGTASQQQLLPMEYLKEWLSQNRNCFFFLKNQVYTRLVNLTDLHDKMALLEQLSEVVSTFELSDMAYDHLLNVLFILFVEGRKNTELAEKLQQIYEQLRRRRALPEFFGGLLRNVKPILESVNNPQDSQFIANVIAKSLHRIGGHLPQNEHLSLLCQINEYFQLGEVVYFSLYKGEYDIINPMLYNLCEEWIRQMTPEEAAATMDTFDTLCDNTFKRFVEDRLQ